MNTKRKRIMFWGGFVVLLGLIIWGMVVALNKPPKGTQLGQIGEITAIDHSLGPVDAPITLIEYSDFQCPACQLLYPFVKKFLGEASTTVSFAYRQFPLQQHVNGFPAAMASEASSAQGKFWEMYTMLFENHTDWENLKDTTDVFIGYAGKIGLDTEQFKKDLASSTLKDKIQASEDGGIKAGVNATPTFFVNGKAISGYNNYEEFKKIIETTAKGNSK